MPITGQGLILFGPLDKGVMGNMIGNRNLHIGLVCRNDVDSAIDLANVIHEAGAAVTLYMPEAHTAWASDDPDRPVERLYEVGLLPRACQVRLRKLPRMRDPRSLGMAIRLARMIRQDRVDVVHSIMGPGELWLAVLGLLLRDLPVVSTMVIPKPNVREDLPDWLVWSAHKMLACTSELIIVNGTDQVSLVQEMYGLSPERVVYVPLCARTTAVNWAVKDSPEEEGTVLFFGAARPSKGLEYLIRAQPEISRQVRKTRILIASRGSELDRCRQLIVDPSGFEIHEGFVSGDVMAELFQRTSVVALPYLSASTSGVLLTAYGFGKPVVSTNVGCLPEYVEDGVTGLLVEPENPEQLAKAVVRLLSNETLRKEMGRNAVRWVEERQRDVAAGTLGAYERAQSMFGKESRLSIRHE